MCMYDNAIEKGKIEMETDLAFFSRYHLMLSSTVLFKYNKIHTYTPGTKFIK